MVRMILFFLSPSLALDSESTLANKKRKNWVYRICDVTVNRMTVTCQKYHLQFCFVSFFFAVHSLLLPSLSHTAVLYYYYSIGIFSHLFDCCVSRVLNSVSTDRFIDAHTHIGPSPIASENEYLFIDFLFRYIHQKCVCVEYELFKASRIISHRLHSWRRCGAHMWCHIRMNKNRRFFSFEFCSADTLHIL